MSSSDYSTNRLVGKRLAKILNEQDVNSRGVPAITRAIMSKPDYSKYKIDTFNGKNKAFLMMPSTTSSSTTSLAKYRQQQSITSFSADHSEKTLQILERAKQTQFDIASKLERTLIAQERRAKALLVKDQKKNLNAFINSQRPVLELEDEQKRRLKLNGDPAKEVAEMRREERGEKKLKQREVEEANQEIDVGDDAF